MILTHAIDPVTQPMTSDAARQSRFTSHIGNAEILPGHAGTGVPTIVSGSKAALRSFRIGDANEAIRPRFYRLVCKLPTKPSSIALSQPSQRST